jgi:hypothetical protein
MFPLAASAFSLFGVVLIIPFALLGLAVRMLVVRRREPGARGTCALDGAIGALLGGLLLSGVRDPHAEGGSPWAKGAAFPTGLLACCAIIKASFGYTLWRLWLRPAETVVRPV